MAVTPLEFEWRRWRLREGEYKGYTGPRPSHFPRVIPLDWWTRLAAFLARRKKAAVIPPYAGIFAVDGVFVRSPDGNAETQCRAATNVGYAWEARNVGDYSPGVWAGFNSRPRIVIPWARVRTGPDVWRLLNIARDWGSSGCIVNLEDEAKDVLPPSLVANIAAGHSFNGEIALSTVGWTYNAVDWQPVAKWPVLLQVFEQLRGHLDECVYHAKALGFQNAFPTLQAYGGATPDREGWTRGISVYTADDVRDWEKWKR